MSLDRELLRAPNPQEFDGKVVLITGGSSGIGAATEQLFVKQNAFPIVLDKFFPAGTTNYEGAIIPCDISDWRQVEHAVTSAADIRGRLDVVVNNAAIKVPGSILDISAYDLERMVLNNGLGMIYVAKAFLPHLVNWQGVLINVCSGESEDLPPNTDGYFASKGVSVSLTYALNASFRDRGVRVVGIAPGPVDTPLWRTGQTEERIKAALEGRRGPTVLQPLDVANQIIRLASVNNAHLTGKIYRM